MDEPGDDAARPEGDAPGWAADPHADTGPIPVVAAEVVPAEPVPTEPTLAAAPEPEPEPEPTAAPVPAGSADPHADTGPIPVVAAAAAAEPHPHVLHGHPHVAPPVHHEPPRHADAPPRRVWPVAAAVAALLLVVGGISAYALTRGGDAVPVAGPTGSAAGVLPGEEGASPSLTGGATPSGTPPLSASRPTLVLGDSLGLTVYPWLADLLPDRYVSYEAEVGRSTANTARALEAMSKVPKVVIVSSGTNDQYASDVKAQATRILDELGPNRCVVWVDVVRPDRVGDPQDEINVAIDAAVAGRSNVRVLRWSEMVAAHPDWLSSDGIHPGQDGAEARAKAFAEASLGCSPLDPTAPKADRQTLPQSVFNGPISGTGSGSGTSGSSGSGTGSSGTTSTRSASPSPTKKPKPTPKPSTASPKPTTASPKPTPTKTSEPPPPTPDPSTQP